MIIHFKTTRSGDLIELIAEKITQKEEHVQELMNIGAIYVEKVRCLSSAVVPVDTYVRVHLQPKKYFTNDLSKLDPLSWIVAEESDFYIVDKPHGLPSHPTLDNIQQNLLALLKQGLGTELWLPHRLDIGTAGLLIVAKSQDAAARIQQEFISKKIQKIYRAIVEQPLPAALHEHFMKKTKNAPKVVSAMASEDTQNCLLKITDCEAHSELYRLTLEPITGRTHQIRAQLTFLENPIVGDKLYGSTLPFTCEEQKHFSQESFALESYQIVWNKTWQRPRSTLF